jgi:hypothetical protein
VVRGKARRSQRRRPIAPAAGRGVARPEHDARQVLNRLGVEGQGRDQRQIARRVVVAVEETELLLAVRRIVGRVQVERDPPGAAVEPAPMVRDHGPGQVLPHADQLAPADPVLEPREGRLRAECRPGQWLAVEHQLVQRVVGEPGGVVAIEIARGQAKDPLPNQVQDRVRDLPRLSRIRQTPGHGLGQAQSLVHGLEQHQPAVRAGVGHVESGPDRWPKTLVSEGQLGYTVCSHRVSPRSGDEASRHRFYSTDEGPVALVFHRS